MTTLMRSSSSSKRTTHIPGMLFFLSLSSFPPSSPPPAGGLPHVAKLQSAGDLVKNWHWRRCYCHVQLGAVPATRLHGEQWGGIIKANCRNGKWDLWLQLCLFIISARQIRGNKNGFSMTFQTIVFFQANGLGSVQGSFLKLFPQRNCLPTLRENLTGLHWTLSWAPTNTLWNKVD